MCDLNAHKKGERCFYYGLIQAATKFFRQGGHDSEEVANDAVLGQFEYGRICVFVDGDDHFGGAHAGLVLDGAADTTGDVEIGADGLAGLANLVIVGNPAGIYGGTGCP